MQWSSRGQGKDLIQLQAAAPAFAAEQDGDGQYSITVIAFHLFQFQTEPSEMWVGFQEDVFLHAKYRRTAENKAWELYSLVPLELCRSSCLSRERRTCVRLQIAVEA